MALRAFAGIALLLASGPATVGADDAVSAASAEVSLRGAAAPAPAPKTVSEPTAEVRAPAPIAEEGADAAPPAVKSETPAAPSDAAAGVAAAPAPLAGADAPAPAAKSAPAPIANNPAPAAEIKEPASAGADKADGGGEEPPKTQNACLCIFDIDRTLTGQQGLGWPRCPANEVRRGVWDDAYGGGDFTKSALGRAGVMNTQCGQCLVGIVSHGAGGADAMKSEVKQMLGDYAPRDDFSWYTDIHSPFVLGCAYKPPCVQAVMEWYNQRGAGLSPQDVYLFDDKTPNIHNFWGTGFNAIQVSCATRTSDLGLCGGTPEEVRLEPGVHPCR